MKFYEIKFSFNHELIDENRLDAIFNNIGKLLDVRFDENLNPYSQKNDGEIYELKEVRDETIEKEMAAFFKFTFKDIIDVPLYKFLVLKGDDELTVLANIHSSIFDYSSVNIIKELFNNPDASNIPKDINSYFEEYDEYLNSSDFENDRSYWDNKLLDAEDYVKYFNIKSNNFRNISFSIENNSLSTFLKNHKISKYNFFTAIFSLYLSKIDSTEGCVLKSSINSDEVVFGTHVKNTLLMIDYYKNDTFEEYLNRIQEDYHESMEHTKVRIEDYVDNSFYYAIHDFRNLNDIDVRNGDGSALTFNIYEDSIDIIYNYEVFSEIYIRYLIENIKHLIDNVLESINQRCCDLEFLSSGDKHDFNGLYELTESQKTIYSDAQNDTGTRYNNPLKLGLRNSYATAKIKKAINKLLKLHPILTSRIIDEGNLIGFDAKPPIAIGSAEDIETFVQPFELNRYLSRFLIVEDKNDVFLCMDFHSLIFDATSFNTLINSLLKILNGENTELVDTGVLREISFEEAINNSEYRDYAQKFYDSALSERDEVNDLVFSVAEDSSKSYVERFGIDEENLTSFLDFHNITRNQFFTSVFAYTLSRFTGSSKVLFDLITDGRAHLGLSDSIGMFYQTSPVLMECGNQSVESFMNYSRNIIDTVSKYDLYSFMELVFDYRLENTVSFGILQDIFSSTIDMEFEMLEKDMWANFSVVVYYAKKDTLEIRIFYSEKYSDNFVKHFADSFRLILEGFIREEMLSDINYVVEADLNLLDSYNKTERNLMFDDLLEAFNFNLFKNPERPLVSYKDKVYNYSQGAFIADKLANALKDAGIGVHDNVAFLVERSELYIFCVLGILSTGATYVPLDDAHPNERIKFILNDTSSNVVVVSDETRNRVKSLNGDAIIINISDIVNGEFGELASLPTVNGDIACILYTSGSTGLPKGVKITRDAILNSVESYASKFKITNEDVYGLFATIGFNTASLAICQSFYSGACLSVVPGDIKLDMVKLNDYFIEQGVTHTLITTQVGKLYMETIKESPLKVILVAGEKLGEFDNPNDYQFVNAFGLTEVFSYITSICNTKNIDSSSIGMWNFNTKMYILDEELRRVPVGAVGELCISGYQISDGYLNREEENNKAFVKNPFDDSKDYDVLFRTGDMVRILPDGTLGIIGRRDTQVKIRGNRVELPEVESVIRQLDYVTDVTVQAVKHESNNELVAYVVADDCDEEKLRENVLEHVGESRPPFMVPSYIIKMDEIPLNVHGKVDKRVLPDVNRDKLRAEYVAPTNDVEKSIVRVFKIIFDQDDIGILDDFVRLGGDSLTAIKVLSYLSEYNFSTADILRLRTPQAIAASIDDDKEFDLDVYSLKDGCPLNEPQLNVYLDIIANKKEDAYNLPFFMNISKDYSLSDIEEALNVMFDFHPILAMHVSDDFEVPYMVNGRKPSISILHAIDNDFIREFLTEPFDLHDSLSRFLILETEDKYGLFAVFHHLVYDASSKHIFKRDLETILDGGSIELDNSFLKVAAFNQQMQDTKEFKEAEEFYASSLADSDDAGILLDDVFGDGPNIYQTTLEIDDDAFKGFLKECNISENILFTSVFAYTLSRFTGSDKVSFNIIENGRDRFDNFDSIGMYVNTLPILADCKDQNISSFMEQMSDLVYDVMRHNYYPFRLLANQFDIDSKVIFQYLPDWIEYADNNAENLDIENELIPYLNDSINDFTVDVRKVGESYKLNINYSAKFSKDMSESFAATYNQVLSQMIGHDKLSDIDYVSQSDLELLDAMNHTERPLDYDDLLDAFNDNLADCPDNNLVSYNDSVYTYSEGAFIADKIAKYLIDYGIETGDNVAFLVERSELYMFSVLSILSIGATYVPLDDGHPDDRIQFILDDTESKIVLVSDETYERAESLVNDAIILNISDILKEDIGTLDKLPVVYGDVACMLYTSGTTGLPKGVKVTRKSILNISAVYVDKFDFDRNDVYGLFANISFDAGSWGICQTIYAGACLSIVPDEIKLDIHELNKYFVEHNVTHTMITTQVGKLFMSGVEDTSLEVLMVGGEKLGDFESPEDYRLIDGFGPTETFAFISSIDNNDKIDSSSIGQINHNIKFYVLDDEFRRVPCGAVGELYVSGYQLAQGYLNREEENAKAFIDNPFDDDEDYGTLYRTGDMVRLLPDKTLAIVGRRDSQVKIRGNRVELSEIESVIREIDYVDDVTVQTIKSGTNNELVAYVVVSDDLEDAALRDIIQGYVGELKPEYMVPSYVIGLDSIPLNVNGKVDKRALPEVTTEDLRAQYVAPNTETERIIVEAFETVFDQDKISLYDDFTRLGGDSIKSIRVISLLQKEGISCNAKDILTYKTPYLIARNIGEEVEVSYDAVEGPVDLLPIQKYFFDEINRNDFTQEFVLEAAGNLDLNILQEAWDELSNVHDMLRATYRIQDGDVVQEVLPLNTNVCRLNEYNIYNDLDENISEIIENSKNSLDISNKLIDISLVQYGGKSYVVFVIHHLIVDGVSWSVILDDLTYIYTQRVSGNEIDLARPYPYKSWVSDVKELVEDISDEEKEHWFEINGLLDDSDIMGKAKAFSFNLENISYDVDNLLNLSEEEYFALGIARAYKRTYGKDIIFNRESYGREERLADVNRTVGWFTTQYPISVDVGTDYNPISLTLDALKLKRAFKEIKNLGLNYSSLIYDTHELEFKHCPVTFNFLSTEFAYKNKLFETFDVQTVDELELDDADQYGVDLNVLNMDDGYVVTGQRADGTYIDDKFSEFVDNIKQELEFIAGYGIEEGIVCCLSEAQLGIYLDEKVNDKGTAYAAPGFVECSSECTVEDMKNAISALIDKHPVLRGRIVDDSDLPLMVCDSNPVIEEIDHNDYDSLIRPFNLTESLCRFYINDDEKVIFYDMHHIINDASSYSIITRDILAALDGSLDEEIDLGFVYASNDSYNAQFEPIYESAQEFFNNLFADIDEVNTILDDLDGTSEILSLPVRGIRDCVEEFAFEKGITVGALLNSIFAYTYSRFVGSDKVYYTFTEHGRHEEYNNDALGMYVRTIPLLVDCKDDSVESFVSYFSDLNLNSMVNSVYPFRLLASEYDLNNEVSFEYNFDLNDVSHVENELIVAPAGDVVSDISCVINDLDDGYLVYLEHSDKYSHETGVRFVEAYAEILTQIVDAERLSDIEYVSKSDLEILDDINQTEHDLVHDDILDAFNENLNKNPDNALVSYYDASYTYSEGAFIADKLADALRNLGVESQDKVAFLVERSELYMLCVLGVMSMGAIYVPLDDKHPDDRIQFILEDTHSSVLIVDDNTYKRAESLTDDAILLNISDVMKEDVGTLDELPVVYGDLACILYTSGTTGIPKGVKITRKSVLNLSEFYIRKYGLGEDDVYALFASIGFDVAMKAIFPTICSGACLSVIPDAIKLDMASMNEYFMKYGVTHTEISTQVAKLFISQVDETSLKVLTTGGEKLGESEIDVDYRFVDSYGPTEACVDVTSIDSDDRIDPSSIGFLLDNIKAYVLDDEARRVPIGAVGELYLAGNQIADGYLNRDEETIKAFLENPFDEGKEYNVMYRTGDIVRVLPDGSLGIVGRRDSQVKIRGNRVELSEIEAVIREIDYIEDLTVQTIKNGTNNELVAYVVVSDEYDGDDLKDDISNYVDERKPEYMIPSFVVELDEIPLNVNGKVDKRALPDVDVDSLRVEYVAPTTETEKLIVNAFEKVFNQENIGIYDDFVRLGGDSLTAIKVLSYLGDYNVTAADILSLRTPFAIAESINKENTLNLDIYTLESGCPLNEPQLNVYLDIVANNKFDSYIIPSIVKIGKDYGVGDILNALDVMLDVHPILGMCVSDDNDVPYLVSGSKPSVEFKSGVDDEYLMEFLTKPFDLYDNLSRYLLVENSGGYSLYASFHHIIFDALSEGVFKKDLETILDGGSVEVDDSFLKVSAFTQQIQNSEEYVTAHNFYDAMLADSNEAGELLDSVLSDGQGISYTDLDLDSNLLKSFLDKWGVSENVLFTSVFAYTLSRFAGSDKVSFNIIENGRDRFNNLDAIGMYVNTLPILVDCKNQSVSDFMEMMSDLVYDVMRYNYYPFRLLAGEYDIDSNIIFQYMPDWIGDDDIEDTDKNKVVEAMNDLITEFNVDVVQKGDKYSLQITYSDKYSHDMIESFAGTYNQILSQMICLDELSDINYVSQSDLELLDSINQTEHDLIYGDILDAFNDNLSDNPEGNLVSFNDATYTYAEGAFIADRFAESLKGLGVGVGDNVAFLVERCELYMFSVLGILSVGATYVPLDDAHPDERIEFILNDTEPKVVIVSDETYERAEKLIDSASILNVSDILKDEIGTLDELPVAYGDLACMLYTSGTTGLPKGVKVTRKSALNVPYYYNEAYGLTHDDVYGMFATIGFDAGSWAILSTICAGACLAVIPEDIRLDMNAMNDYFIGHDVTHTFITTQVGKMFVDSVEDTSLDVLVVGGEKLGEFASPENYELIDIYGPTEAFVFVASKNNNDKIDFSSVGDLIYNTKAYILDDEFRRVPVGAVGELYLAGDQIAHGYLNRDEETNHAFIDNPFDEGDYGVLYRTGDMVRILPDNSLAVVGRRDSQVKIRGNRVELSEIEAVIREIDYVDNITVQTIKHDTNNELVAYVVVTNDLDGDALSDSICDYVGERKPEYMIPSYVIKLDEIPVNVNGKVDRRALPEVDVEGLRVEYVAPTTETEKHVVEAFERVFDRENIGIYDDFARLGGDSITAIKLTSILSKYDISINARIIFDNKTPYQIAKVIDDDQSEYGFYLAKEGTENQNMFILPPVGGMSMAFSQLIDNLEFEGNVYLIDDFKYDLTVNEIKNTDHNMTFEKYWNAIKDIFQDGDLIVGYSLGCLFSMLIVEKLEKDRKIEKCVLIDGTLDFYSDDVPDDIDESDILNELYGLGFDDDEIGVKDNDELVEKMVEIFAINSVWDFQPVKINDTPVIYLASEHGDEDKLENIARNGEFIFIDDTDHTAIITADVEKIVKYLK